MTDRYYDLERILGYRRILRELDPEGDPNVEFVARTVATEVRQLALLPGSFNPPTTAHVALADSVLRRDDVDAVAFVLGTVTVNKSITGLSLEDRLLLLTLLAEDHPALEVAVVNRGLLVDQAEIMKEAIPYVNQLWFVVGFDKIVQIFDPGYYSNRDRALGRLFGLASFFVAPRGNADFEDLARLLEQPENRKYANGVVPLPLPADLREVSSSHLRAEVESSRGFPDVPAIVSDFLKETGAYVAAAGIPGGEAIDRYDWRQRIVRSVEAGALAVSSASEFRALVRSATNADANGQILRDRLARAGLIDLSPHSIGRAS